MKIYETIVIGGGPSGISCVYHLKNLGIDYLLIEQKEMLQTWKHERWESFYLVTPNWMTNLPGVDHLIPYDNAYMSRSEIEHVLIEYLNHVDPNYVENTVIKNIDKQDDYYCFNTNNGIYYAKNIIVAIGMFNKPFVPAISKDIPGEVNQIHSMDYFNPEQLEDGATLVVGAGRSGVQIALEVKQKKPYDCYLSVGSLTPLPTIYKNINGVYWLNRLSGYKDGKDHLPYKHEDLINDNIVNKLNKNLYNCQKEGVKLLGRMIAADSETIEFAENLKDIFISADRYKNKIEKKVNDMVEGESFEMNEPSVVLDTTPVDHHNLEEFNHLNLKQSDIKNIIWCTGFKPNYSWLTLDIFDDAGNLNLIDGVSTTEKVYFCGLSLQPDPETKSSFGVGLFALVESAKRAVESMAKDMQR